MMEQQTRMNLNRIAGVSLTALALCGVTLAQEADLKPSDQKANQTDAKIGREAAARADRAKGPNPSVEKLPQPKRIEDSYPLPSDADREKTAKLLQQLVVDLLALFNQSKEAHWNLNGPLYLPLHEQYQEQADYFRAKADVFAERNLALGYSVDGRYSTIARTTKIPDFPGGYVTDTESLKLLIDRITVLQKEVYQDLRAIQDSDPPTSNQLQDLAFGVDKNLWKLRIHLQKPGSTGQDLPWTGQQGRERAGN